MERSVEHGDGQWQRIDSRRWSGWRPVQSGPSWPIIGHPGRSSTGHSASLLSETHSEFFFFCTDNSRSEPLRTAKRGIIIIITTTTTTTTTSIIIIVSSSRTKTMSRTASHRMGRQVWPLTLDDMYSPVDPGPCAERNKSSKSTEPGASPQPSSHPCIRGRGNQSPRSTDRPQPSSPSPRHQLFGGRRYRLRSPAILHTTQLYILSPGAVYLPLSQSSEHNAARLRFTPAGEEKTGKRMGDRYGSSGRSVGWDCPHPAKQSSRRG